MTQAARAALVRIKRSGLVGRIEKVQADARVTVRLPLLKAVVTVRQEDVIPLTPQEAGAYRRRVEDVCRDARCYAEELGRAGWEIWPGNSPKAAAAEREPTPPATALPPA